MPARNTHREYAPGRNPFLRGKLGRRQALQATGAGFVMTLAALLAGAGRTARALPAAGLVPVVDRQVRVVAGNFTDRFSIPQRTTGLGVGRVGATERPSVAPHATLRAGWGLICSMTSTAICFDPHVTALDQALSSSGVVIASRLRRGNPAAAVPGPAAAGLPRRKRSSQ